MGEFDDVLAMEPGDEWDLVDLEPEVAATLPAVVAVLRLPGALVELRGEVPPALLARLEPLTDDRLLSDDPVAVPLVLAQDQGRWMLTTPHGDVPVAGARADDLERAVLHELDALVLAADAARLHLAVTCVEIAGTGIVLVSDRPEDRAEVAAELLRRGAALVTERLLTVLPGSQTVFAYPAPGPALDRLGGERVAVTPFTAIDVVGFVHRTPSGGPPIVTPLSTPEACIRLMSTVVDRERFGPAVLDVIASSVTNASHREVLHESGAAAAEVLRSTAPPPRRAFSVVHRFDEVSDERPTIDREVASLRVARFDDGAVALDARSGTLLELSGEEIDALEELLVDSPGRCGSGPDERLERLGASGMYVPDAHGRRRVPGPEAFGLPNCPSGDTARAMWAQLAEREDGRPSAVVSTPDGSTALAVLRGVLPGDDEQRRTAIEVHRRLQDEVVGVERQLLHTIDVLGAAGIEPLVLGSVVNAHDGPLPPYFAEAEQVDLLVHDGQLAPAVRALEAVGHRRVGLPVAGDGETHGIVDLRPADGGAGVRVRDTLASGPFGALVDHEEFHRRSVPIRVHGRWCRSLHPEHRFVHACVQVEAERDVPTTQLARDVVLAAPRADALMAEAMEASERWGATATVTAAVRRVDEILPGLPPWIVERSFRDEPGGGRERRGMLGRRGRRGDRSRG